MPSANRYAWWREEYLVYFATKFEIGSCACNSVIFRLMNTVLVDKEIYITDGIIINAHFALKAKEVLDGKVC